MENRKEPSPTAARATDFETLNSCHLCGSRQLTMLDAACNVCRCQGCGYVFDNPRPAAEAVAQYYSKPTKYDSWLAEEKVRDTLWKRRLKKMSKTKNPGSLLDVGTGIGQLLHHAQPYYAEVYGTEVSASAISVARSKYGLTVFQGDIEKIDFNGKVFDNIALFHVLEHVPNPRMLIERCRSLLSTDGILVIAVPNDLCSMSSRVRRWLKYFGVRKFRTVGKLGLKPITLDGTMQEIHVSHFTSEVLVRFLERSGFRVLENGLDPYFAAAGLLNVVHKLYYLVCSILLFALGRNYYDTIWLVARKK